MNVEIILIPDFEREAKKLVKKYRSLKGELTRLLSELKENPKMGTLIRKDVYKIRLAVKSKGKGKSGGMRVITFVEIALIENDESIDVYLLSIYDKSERKNISDKFLSGLIEEIRNEIAIENNKTNFSEEE